MISCLTITQPGRLSELTRAIRCFCSQTFTERELVIVHDGNADFHRAIRQFLENYGNHVQFQLHTAPSGLTLGELRNFSVQLARYPLVCQWDDDDLYHPRRLETQFAYLKIHCADFCFLTDQLHLFEDTNQLYWDDWNVEIPPMNLIQGTLMGNKQLLGRYPALARGEDTPVVRNLVQCGYKIAALGGMGWLYIYTYSGKNVWGREHHAAISAWKHLHGKRLIEKIGMLDTRLKEYPADFRVVEMPCEQQRVTLQIGRQQDSV